jgi:hypothetical protein
LKAGAVVNALTPRWGMLRSSSRGEENGLTAEDVQERLDELAE